LQCGDFHPHLINCLRELILSTATSPGAPLAASSVAAAARGDTAGIDVCRCSLQAVRKCRYRCWLTSTHTLHQEPSLPIEELKDFPLKTAVVEGHPRHVRVVEHEGGECDVFMTL
jgi:hypothetical protein